MPSALTFENPRRTVDTATVGLLQEEHQANAMDEALLPMNLDKPDPEFCGIPYDNASQLFLPRLIAYVTTIVLAIATLLCAMSSIVQTNRFLTSLQAIIASSPSPTLLDVTVSDPNKIAAIGVIFWGLITGVFAFFVLGIMLETQEEYQKDVAKGLARDPNDTVDRMRNKTLVYGCVTLLQLGGVGFMMWNGGDVQVKIGDGKPTTSQLAEIYSAVNQATGSSLHLWTYTYFRTMVYALWALLLSALISAALSIHVLLEQRRSERARRGWDAPVYSFSLLLGR